MIGMLLPKPVPKDWTLPKFMSLPTASIRMHGENIGYLMTKKSHKNFELSLEYRWKHRKKNSIEAMARKIAE